METIRNWTLPLLLATGQAAWLWSQKAGQGGPLPQQVALACYGAAVAVATAGLILRRRAPVKALAWVLGASVLGHVAAPDDYADIGLLCAVYSVAVRCPPRVTLRAVAAVVGCSWLVSAPHIGFGPALATELVITAVVYVVCAGLGEARRHWLTGRLTAARRLAGAEEGRRGAADAERHRLARELHDVGAHHLTSVVVTVDAARRLGGNRPELAAEALEFAEKTGLETLTAIQRLVAVMQDVENTGRPDPRPMTGPIQELVAGFGRLGRPIATEIPDDLVGPAAEAVFGIVREALTNALRYAPGAAVGVGVRRAGDTLELTVDNEAPRASSQHEVAGLGSGRGVAGMRERAAAVGGTLTAGPRPGGGWRVRAMLPDTTGPLRPGVRARRRDFLREQRLADSALAFTATVVPVFVLFVAAEDWKGGGGPGVRAIGLLSVLMAVHALPLLWRRRAPWAALAGVMATAWLWPVVRALGELPSPVSQFLACGALTEALGVYAVAAYGRGALRTWPAVFAATVGAAGALTVAAGADGRLMGEALSADNAVFSLLELGFLIGPLLALAWGAGLAVRARRLRILAREDSALADSVRQAEAAADGERRLLAARLHDRVLHRTTALVELARAGRLDEVASEARSALAAMRELLHSLREGGDQDGRRCPQPTAADLEELCHQLRASGREVTLRGMPEAAAGLSAPVALSVYRVVEAALGAGDRGPARVTLRRRRDELRITVSGVRLAVTGPVAERLRVQACGADGQITLDTTGTVRVFLPLPAGPDPVAVQEVSP
ncbi:sensor histidine kinase [Streptomyces sp. NPDC019531]|uniref:sensor histidine kinase n=1 Tax=Streptomyces sp. NPDC019531 TaxID=3365062 RepID=UPI00384B7C73